MRLRSILLLALACGTALGARTTPRADPAFVQKEGLNLNSFVRKGPVAAHIVLRSGSDPRLIVAFPAGNSGVGLWFDHVQGAPQWTMTAPAAPVTVMDAKGRPLHGVSFTAGIAAPRLTPKQAVLSSVRVLRDYQALGTAPAELLTALAVRGDTLTWARDRLDGAAGYRLSVRIVAGRWDGQSIVAAADGRIVLAITAVSGETPLTPVPIAGLLTAQANADAGARRALEFLSYREKFLAGSWRFNTYFGRDTLMSVRLLMPVLQPAAVETGLNSVLERLSDKGQVAHEEDIGEFAILDHMKADGTRSDAPTYNYNMIDSDFMLAPVARAWLIDDPRGKARAAAFLAQRHGKERAGDALMRNLRYVLRRAGPFAQNPAPTNLISLNPGMDAGEWRDSNDGLGGGRFPYDVNAIFVPAALDAAAAMSRAGLLTPYMTSDDQEAFARLPDIEATWRSRTPGLFAMTIPAARARTAIEAYAAQAGVPATAALQAVGPAGLRFNAIALDAEGAPVPIENSDEGFALLFGRPDDAALTTAADVIGKPFPAGLMTGAGMLVANPAFAPGSLAAKFGPNAYHGTVVWSWQQALAAAGLERQLTRNDVSPGVRAKLRATQQCLWRAIAATRQVQSSELWSWRYIGGGYEVAAFGASGRDVDESNAAQLWSTVYLALKRPAPGGGVACPAN
jgi:glycogen debranching enzyme